MVGADQCVQDSVVQENSGLDAEFTSHFLIDVEDPEAAAGVGVQSDEDLELLLGGGLPLGIHELRDLVGGAEEAGGIERVGKGVVGGEGVAEAFLATGPVEEAGGDGGVE